MTRLGLFGKGLPIKDKREFVKCLKSGDEIAAMELVARCAFRFERRPRRPCLRLCAFSRRQPEAAPGAKHGSVTNCDASLRPSASLTPTLFSHLPGRSFPPSGYGA